MAKAIIKKLKTSLALDQEIVNWLDGVAERESVSRSWLANAIIREQMRRSDQQEPKPLVHSLAPRVGEPTTQP